MRTEDRLDINDVLSIYATAIDTRDWEMLRSVLTDHAVLDYTSSGGPRGGFEECVGWLEASLSGFTMTQHLVTNVIVNDDGPDAATSSSYVHCPLGIDKGEGRQDLFFSGGGYDDRLVKTSDGWRIAERVQWTSYLHGPVQAFTQIRAARR